MHPIPPDRPPSPDVLAFGARRSHLPANPSACEVAPGLAHPPAQVTRVRPPRQEQSATSRQPRIDRGKHRQSHPPWRSSKMQPRPSRACPGGGQPRPIRPSSDDGDRAHSDWGGGTHTTLRPAAARLDCTDRRDTAAGMPRKATPWQHMRRSPPHRELRLPLGAVCVSTCQAGPPARPQTNRAGQARHRFTTEFCNAWMHGSKSMTGLARPRM